MALNLKKNEKEEKMCWWRPHFVLFIIQIQSIQFLRF